MTCKHTNTTNSVNWPGQKICSNCGKHGKKLEIIGAEEDMASRQVRRTGVATVPCRACLTLNGITLGVQFYRQAAFFRCWKCDTVCITSAVTERVTTRSRYMQRGVKVHGTGRTG